MTTKVVPFFFNCFGGWLFRLTTVPFFLTAEASKANSSQRRKVAVVILLVAVAIIAGAVRALPPIPLATN